MPTENPYQSPESDSTPPQLPTDDLVLQRWPTWRFWVLFLICIPGFLLFALPIQYFADPMGPVRSHVYYTLPYSIIFLFFLLICLLLFVNWRLVFRLPGARPRTSSAGIFLGSLVVLSLFAATSAFTTICTTATVASRETPPPANLFLMFGIFAISLIGPILVVLLARGLYLDAIGRPKKPDDELPRRPIPRLRARRPTQRE